MTGLGDGREYRLAARPLCRRWPGPEDRAMKFFSNAGVALLCLGDAAGAQPLLWTQAKPGCVQRLAAVNQLIDFEEARIQAADKIALAGAGSFLTVMLTALVLALVTAGTLAWMISRRITPGRWAPNPRRPATPPSAWPGAT